MGKGDQQSGKLTAIRRSIPSKQSAEKRLYTVPEVMKLTGLSRKQVEYWAAIGLLVPTLRDASAVGSQPASFYSMEAVVKALIMCDLRSRGFTPRQVQQVAGNLEAQGVRLGDPDMYLLTDGYSVYYANSNNEVTDILKHHRQMLLLVPLREQVEKLRMAS
jgi:DNA-binding transcriptional MerR regulator